LAADKPPSAQPCTGQGYGDPDCRQEPDDEGRWKKSSSSDDVAAAAEQDSDSGDSGWRKIEGSGGGTTFPTPSHVNPKTKPLPAPQKLVDTVPKAGTEPR
jgi:hypothetical protein